jgi:predicted HTH transcriptional regulator
MDLKEIKALVKQGEGMHIEFKLKAAHPEKIVREVVAFANSKGGWLLVGVGDDKSIPGLKFVDEDEYILTRAIAKYCYPSISYTLEKVPVTDEREVLVLAIQPSDQKPHYVMHDDDPNQGKVYVRVADRSVQASKEMREVLKGERKQKSLRFEYGDKEKLLMQYLELHQMITVDQFSDLANIPRKIASRTLVLLVLANVLKILPHEVKDYFTTASRLTRQSD